MTEYVVNRQHVFRDNRGNPLPKNPGDRVDVSYRTLAKKLLEQGIICQIELERLVEKKAILHPRPHAWVGTRVAIVIHTSQYYSGGRIHLYQYAWSLARAGADVIYVSERIPKWANDYPKVGMTFVTVNSSSELPNDIDLLITDGKDSISAIALDYRKSHPRSRLAVMNFETPNWMQGFDANTAKRMQSTEHALRAADMWVCNSSESVKFLREYMKDFEKPCVVLHPAANNTAVPKDNGIIDSFAAKFSNDNPVRVLDPKTPYIVSSARGSAYKCTNVAISSAFSYHDPLNMVCIGASQGNVKDQLNHKLLSFGRAITDAEKMTVFKEAVCVAAPSLFEGFGMVPSEALSCGTPVVVYELPVLRQNYGDNLIYAKWDDPADFAKKVHQVADYRLKKVPVEVETHKLHPDKELAQKTYGLDNMQDVIKEFPYHFVKGNNKITAQMICYYGPTVQEAMASVYPYVDELMIAHGPVTLWKDVPPDNSLDLIKAFPDPENKIKLEIRKEWKHKGQMRTWCSDYSSGNRMLIVDADEIYDGLEEWIKHDPFAACPKWVHFWHDIQHYVVDSNERRWGFIHKKGVPGTVYNHFRWSHWGNGYAFQSSRGTTGISPSGNGIGGQSNTEAAVDACINTVIYHLGHVLDPDLMKAKHEFYRKRDGDNAGRKQRQTAWHKWNGELGQCGDGVIKAVDWELPELVHQAFARIENHASK